MQGAVNISARSFARAVGRRSVATFAIQAPEAVFQDLRWHQEAEERLPSQRAATAAIARRQQWQTIPMDCPKTLAAAMQEPCSQARIITEISYPHKVVFANAAWEQLCGWGADEVKGRNGLAFLQGPETDEATVQRINAAVKYGERIHVQLVNHKKDGTPFLNDLRVTPLRSQLGELTHCMGILEEVSMAPGLACELSRHTSGQQQQQQQQQQS